jgi:hypothetical protein
MPACSLRRSHWHGSARPRPELALRGALLTMAFVSYRSDRSHFGIRRHVTRRRHSRVGPFGLVALMVECLTLEPVLLGIK